MKIQFTFKDVSPSEELKRYTEGKVKKLAKHFEREPEIKVVFKKENNTYLVEAEVREGPFVAFASEKAYTFEAGLDAVMEDIQRQLHRKLGKIRDKKREKDKRARIGENAEEVERAEFEYKVVKPEVYSIDDAKLLLDDYGGAIVFVNQDTGKVSVLHRTAKGNVELIEIDM